jgi:hypothetical protein
MPRPPLRISALHDQPRTLERLEVFRDRRLTDLKRLGQLRHRANAFAKLFEHRAPGGVGERSEDEA